MLVFRLISAAVLAACALATFAEGQAAAANNRPLIFGMNPTGMADWNVPDPDASDAELLAKMREAGAASARIGLNWDQIEKSPGVRDWSSVDRWVWMCLDNNIEPVILINSTPSWALPADVDPDVSIPEARYPPSEAHAETFNQWIFDLVRRYRGQARYYEFWNEANGYGWYTALQNPPSFGRADLYTPWMVRAYKALKLADPTSLMSTTGIDDSGATGHAPSYLEGIYNYGGQGYFDAVADHPYPYGGAFQQAKITNIRNVLDAHGDTDVKVWITEFGYSMNPDNYPAYQGYVIDFFNKLTSDTMDYVRIATWHTANDFPWEPNYGLLDRYLNPKPPCNSFKNYAKPARPQITGVSAVATGSTSIRVTYYTDVASRGLVMYGLDKSYGRITSRETAAVTTHTADLVGLEPSKLYHFRIRVGAVEDGDAFSADLTASTTGGQAVKLVLGPTVTAVTQTGATISWTTDVPSSTLVQYSEDFRYNNAKSGTGAVTEHSVTLSALDPGKAYQYRIVSSASGKGTLFHEAVPFKTLPVSGELLNGSFEQGSSNWTFWEVYPWGNGAPDYPGHVSLYTNNGGAFPPNPATKDGSYRLTIDKGYQSAVGGVYQTVAANNGLYLVSGWMAGGGDGGSEIIELIARDGSYSSGIPDGNTIGRLYGSSGWIPVSGLLDVTTSQITVATRVSQYYAVGAVAGHFDGIQIRPVVQGRLSQIKFKQPGEVVMNDAPATVTVVVSSKEFYMQDAGRASGVRVRTNASYGIGVGQAVTVVGELAVIDGVLTLDKASVVTIADGTRARPLAIAAASIGGRQMGTQPAVGASGGLNNTGLFVGVYGRYVAGSGGEFFVDGGAGQVRCRLVAGSPNPAWQMIRVTGISSARVSGSSVEPEVLATTVEPL